jgi:hypothetical protein
MIITAMIAVPCITSEREREIERWGGEKGILQ